MGYYRPGTVVELPAVGRGLVIKDTDWLTDAHLGNLVLLENHLWVWATEAEMKLIREAH